MKLTCPVCGHAAEIPDDRLPPAGARAKCGGCGQACTFDGHDLVDDDSTPINPLDAVDDDGKPAGAAAAGGAVAGAAVAGAAAAGAAAGGPAVAGAAIAGAALGGAAVAGAAGAGKGGDGADEPWLLRAADGSERPHSLGELKNLIRSGQLEEWHEVRRPGEAEWVSAGQTPELKRYFAIRARTQQARAADDDGPTAPRCARHPTTDAEWTCAECHAHHCDECVVLRDIGTVRDVRTCPDCEGACRAAEKPRVIVPFTKELGDVFAYPVKGLGWIAVVTFVVLWWMSFVGGTIFCLVRWFLHAWMYAYILMIIRNTAEGGRRLPDVGGINDWKNEAIWPGVRAIAVSILVLIPFNLYTNLVVAPTLAAYGFGQAAAEARERAEAAREEAAADGEDGMPEGRVDPDLNEDGVVTMEEEAMAAAMEGLAANGYATPDAEWQPPADTEWEPEGGWESDEWAEDDWAEDPYESYEPPGAADVALVSLGAIALLGYALVFWPILLIIVALFNRVLPAFRPDIIIQVLGQVKREYGRLILFLLAVGIPMVFMLPVVSTDPTVQYAISSVLPFPVRLVIMFVFFYLALVVAYAMGRTAEEIDQKVGW